MHRIHGVGQWPDRGADRGCGDALDGRNGNRGPIRMVLPHDWPNREFRGRHREQRHCYRRGFNGFRAHGKVLGKADDYDAGHADERNATVPMGRSREVSPALLQRVVLLSAELYADRILERDAMEIATSRFWRDDERSLLYAGSWKTGHRRDVLLSGRRSFEHDLPAK